MKAYKTYKVEVWFVTCDFKYKVATVQQTARVVDNADAIIMDVLRIELSKTLFTLVGSKAMEEIINGYESYSN